MNFIQFIWREWIEEELKCDYVLRIKAGTFIEFDGEQMKSSQIAACGESFQLREVKITKDAQLQYRTSVTVHWAAGEEEAWFLATSLEKEPSIEIYAKRFWIEEMFSDHKSRGLNLEKTRLTDLDRLQRLLVAVTLAYLWLMQIGFCVVTTDNPKQVDNKGAERSISLCQIGFRWLRELLNDGLSPPLLTVNFGEIGMA